jgi:hypothetical protein
MITYIYAIEYVLQSIERLGPTARTARATSGVLLPHVHVIKLNDAPTRLSVTQGP